MYQKFLSPESYFIVKYESKEMQCKVITYPNMHKNQFIDGILAYA